MGHTMNESIPVGGAEKVLVSLDDYEEEAKTRMENSALGYYKSGAGDELTVKINRSSYDKLRIRPRFLRDVSNRNYETEIFNDRVKLPIGICPAAMQKLSHPDGELANVRAADKAGLVFTLSTLSTCSIEEVAKAAPNCVKWFQLYVFKDREITKNLVRRAEKAGFKAIVLTVDAPLLGIRRADARNNFKMPANLKYANFEHHNQSDERKFDFAKYFSEQLDQSLNWNDLKWLVEFSKIPVLAKGILTKEDAILAVKNGAKGICVSNHGGRQLDSSPSSIEALPEIFEAVGKIVPIILDGGVRQGTDVFKGLALGASMVFFARPALWGLAVDGQAGVEKVIEIIRKEFDNTMALTGCRSISDIEKNMVVHENYYLKL